MGAPGEPLIPAAAQQVHRPAGDRREPGSEPETRARLASHDQENRPSADTRCKAALSPTQKGYLMKDLTELMEAVNAAIKDSARRQGIATLGELRAALKMLPPEMPVVMDKGGVPGDLDSYRGYYELLRGKVWHRGGERLAVETRTDGNVAVAEFIASLDRADGAVFHGYKGGEYRMDSSTLMHSAEYGCCGDAIVGVRVDGGQAVIVTAEEEW